MSEESAAPAAPDPAVPAPPGAPRTMRPPPRKGPVPPQGDPSKVKAYLVIGIIVATVILVPLVAWRVYVHYFKPKDSGVNRNVGLEFNEAWDASKKAQDDIFKIQASVWNENKALGPAELDKIKAGLAAYQKTSEAFHELNAVMQKAGKTNSKEFQDIGERLILLKTWIWDANGMLDPASKPPKYGGLYIPMYSADKERIAGAKRMKEIRDLQPEIIARRNPEEIGKIVKEIREIEGKMSAIRDELLQLDEDLLKGLTLPDLRKEQLRELAELREFQNLAQMSFMEARNLRSQFPTAEQLAPPKEDPPKEEPPKQEPPKQEPPKQDPPKEEPPKETPK